MRPIISERLSTVFLLAGLIIVIIENGLSLRMIPAPIFYTACNLGIFGAVNYYLRNHITGTREGDKE